MHSDLIKKNLDWKQVRYLKFERHTHSLGRSVKQFFYAAILLSLAMLVLRIHLKQRGRIPDGTPDPIIAQDFTPDDSSDFDIDIE